MTAPIIDREEDGKRGTHGDDDRRYGCDDRGSSTRRDPGVYEDRSFRDEERDNSRDRQRREEMLYSRGRRPDKDEYNALNRDGDDRDDWRGRVEPAERRHEYQTKERQGPIDDNGVDARKAEPFYERSAGEVENLQSQHGDETRHDIKAEGRENGNVRRTFPVDNQRGGDHRGVSDDRHVDQQKHENGHTEKDVISSEKNDATMDLINLFVRNVAKHVSEEQLVALFSKYGKVDSAVVVRDPHSRECRGFGFVKMLNDDEAAKALETFQDYEFEGRRISVERAKRKNPHSRTPGAYMGIDRRIRDRYAGMKRSRAYEGGYHQGHYDPYGPPAGRGGYRGRYEDDGRGRYDDRSGWGPRDSRVQPRPLYEDRERARRRYEDPDDRNHERDNRFRDREPPVPREPTDDFV